MEAPRVDWKRPLVSIDQLEIIANGIDHAEGICLSPDGHLYVSGEAGQIYRIETDDSATEVASTGGWTLGLAADGEGFIYACDPAKHTVWRVDPNDGSTVVLSEGAPGRPFKQPNWGAFGPDGTYYMSDSGTWKGRDGCIFVIGPDGRTELWSEESRDFPNGLAVSPDGKSLYALESTPGRLVQFAIRADGTAGHPSVLADLPGIVPDGVAVAADSSLIIACYRPDAVLRWRSDIGLQVVAHDPEGTALAAPTNCAFFGPDFGTVAVPNLGRWHVTRFRIPDVRGTPLFYPAFGLRGI